jgi:hypothetical protein
VHRDIKPENILLAQGHAVIADFGIARAIQQAGGERITIVGLTVGRRSTSPEQPAAPLKTTGAATSSPRLRAVRDAHRTGAARRRYAATRHRASSRARPTCCATRGPTCHQTWIALKARWPRSGARFDSAENSSRRSARLGARAGLATLSTVQSGALRHRDCRRRGRRVDAMVLPRLRGPSRGASGPARLGVAVFPFHATDAIAAQWEEAIPDLLATSLDGVPGVVVADPWSVWRDLRPDPHAHARSPAPDEAAALARRARANYFILGSIRAGAHRPDQHPDVSRWRRGVADLAVAGSVDSVTSLLRQVCSRPLPTIGGGGQCARQHRTTLTRSPEALKARRLRIAGAVRPTAPTRRSTARCRFDSTFVLAMIDAVIIRWVQFTRGQPYANLRDLPSVRCA